MPLLAPDLPLSMVPVSSANLLLQAQALVGFAVRLILSHCITIPTLSIASAGSGAMLTQVSLHENPEQIKMLKYLMVDSSFDTKEEKDYTSSNASRGG